MQRDETIQRLKFKNLPGKVLGILLLTLGLLTAIQTGYAQENDFPLIENNDPAPSVGSEQESNSLGSTLPATNDQNPEAENQTASQNQEAAPTSKRKGISFLSLLSRGGWFMFPLGLLSIAVVAIGVERYLALRDERIFPNELVDQIGGLCLAEGGLDPRRAYQACQANPSSASYIIRSALTRVGRPQSEIENAVNEASQREATRLAQPVSWLTLAAGVAPLVGLLGTVWGITQCFFDTTQLPSGQSVRTVFSVGIYTAMVTTMCGLLIAIPAAILAHFYENRIMRLINEIQEMATNLLPQFERYEGQLRFATENQFSNGSQNYGSMESNPEASRSEPVYSAPNPQSTSDDFAPVVSDIPAADAVPAAQISSVDQLAVPPLRKTKSQSKPKRKKPNRPR